MKTDDHDDQNPQSKWEQIGFLPKPASFATTAIHMKTDPDSADPSTTLPLINLTSTYKLLEAHNPHGYQYSRFGNPTRNFLEQCLAKLEDSKNSITFSSSLGAQTAIIATVKRHQAIIVDCHVNADSIRLFKNFTSNMEMELSVIDLSDLNAVKNSLKESTRFVWLETPSSRSMTVLDVKKICDFVHENSANAKVVVDNTVLSSYLQRPLKFGADIVVSSITKYIHGYPDVVMGYIAVDDDKVFDKLKYHQGAMGIIPSPFDCYMVIKNLKTLSLRMEQHMQSTYKLAKWLEKQPCIEKVLHPALTSHPEHFIACRQSSGHSGFFAFKFKENDKIERFLKCLNVFEDFEVAGSLESFMKVAEKVADGSFDDGLVIVSVGLENVDDLIEDVRQALD